MNIIYKPLRPATEQNSSRQGASFVIWSCLQIVAKAHYDFYFLNIFFKYYFLIHLSEDLYVYFV